MSSPLAAYNFDEDSGIVLDVTGNGLDFSIAGASVTRVAGHTGNGLRSTGLAPASLPDVGRTNSRTLMAWLSFTDIVTSWPVQFNTPSIDSGGWGILYLVPNIVIQARNASTFVRASAAWPADGQPHHVAGTYDGTSVRLYLDGVLQGAPVALAGPLRTDTDPPRLWSGTGTMTAGYIDDLRLFDAALIQAEIQTLRDTPVTADSEPEPEPEPEPEVPTAQVGGWRILAETARWNAAAAEREQYETPVACPTHGDPLESNSDGVLNCPLGDYRVQR